VAFRIGRFRQIMKLIIADPDSWDQRRWHCGTTHCVGGHAELMAAGVDSSSSNTATLVSKKFQKYEAAEQDAGRWSTEARAAHWLGITMIQAGKLFYSHNTLRHLKKIAKTGRITMIRY